MYVKFEGLVYIIFHKIKKFDIDMNIIDKTVAKSHEIKKLGIFIEDDNKSSSSSEEEDLID